MGASVRSRVFAAKVPSAQTISGSMASSCLSRNGSQAAISSSLGLRFPGGRHFRMLQM